MWTLVVFLTIGGPSIVIDGFSNRVDCIDMGQLNVEFVQFGRSAKARCDKTGRPPTICKRDTRTYGRTGECIT
jgi:hypothetical protein